jgi:hypothetical protein
MLYKQLLRKTQTKKNVPTRVAAATPDVIVRFAARIAKARLKPPTSSVIAGMAIAIAFPVPRHFQIGSSAAEGRRLK